MTSQESFSFSPHMFTLPVMSTELWPWETTQHKGTCSRCSACMRCITFCSMRRHSEETHSGKTLTYRRFAAWALECVFPASSPSNSTSYLLFSAVEAAAAAGTSSLWKYPIWPLCEWMSKLRLHLHPANRQFQAVSDRDSPINCVMLCALI